MIRVRFFATLRELVGQGDMEMDVQPGATVAELFGSLESRFPAIAQYRPILLVAVNEEYSGWETHLADGDEVAFFPPVSGGSA